MRALPAGLLCKRITLMQKSAGQSATTGDALPPSAFATVWAEIKPMNGSESYRAQQFVADANILVIIRYRDGVRADMTVNYGTRTFQILAVLNEEEANVQLNLLCKEINP